jgi:4-hydroxybenzoate polyprenyltransferase
MKWLLTFRKLTMLEHTLFGLPLALIGALLPFANPQFAGRLLSHEWLPWAWILLAFAAARTSGMAFNRLIDKDIDALNPRTRERPLQKGEISPSQVAFIAWGGLVLFVFCCSQLNFLCFLLSPLIAFLIWAYSYTKRFTALCHFVIGLIEFFAPIMGWIAVTGTWDIPPILMGAGVLFWISGMDIIYASQDVNFDREYRLHSMPVALGLRKSLLLARSLHALSVILFFLSGLAAGVNFIYYIGLGIVSGLFIYQHSLIKPRDLRHMKKAFFTCNSLIAITQCVFTFGAISWDVML